MTRLKKTHTGQEQPGILSDISSFSNLDIHFARFIARLSKTESPEVPLAAAIVSSKTGEGNVCIDLKEYSGKVFTPDADNDEGEQVICPSFSEWTDLLLKSGTAARGRGSSPLVLDRDGRLYLRRYWEYEKAIADFILERTTGPAPDINYSRLAKDLQGLFQPPAPGKTDWQKICAIMAAANLFTVVSGGPGTGKTTTVAKIIALLHGQHLSSKKLRLVLGAPTGKAAFRLQEAINATGLLAGKIELPQAATLHRMLGALPHSPYFRHNSDNPLDADVIIIDEASMVDLPLMAKLMQAVPPSARLILLGDRHQLASVQPGSVLGDICPPEFINCYSDTFSRKILEVTGEALPPAPEHCRKQTLHLQDSFIELVENYRFPEKSGIAELSQAVKDGDGDTALDLLLSKETGQISWSELPSATELEKKLQNWPGFNRYVSMQHSRDPAECFKILDRHRILCGLRRGPFSMQRINSLLTQELADRYSLSRTGSQRQPHSGSFLPGQPVMVTRNDYSLQLFNGDMGIILPDQNNKDVLRIFFKEESGTLRNMGLDLLPDHETVFAITVHKSQGSEFEKVLLILPDQDSPLLTRELLYTAITRARDNIEIWGRKNLFCRAVKRNIKRTSGLTKTLWGNDF